MATSMPAGPAPVRTPKPMDVIILSYYRVRDTIAAMHSVLDQTGVDVSLWILDQASPPDQVALLKAAVRDDRVHLLCRRGNAGVPGGRNIATRLGRAPFVVCLDNDAEFADPGALERAWDRMAADPGLGALGFRIRNFFTGADDVTSWSYPQDINSFADRAFTTTVFVGCGHVIRREAFERAHGYDPVLRFMEDEKDLCYRIINCGYRIAYHPAIIVRHKTAPEGRVDWSAGRFFYLCRNVIYLHWKFRMSPRKKLQMTKYFLRDGWRLGLLRQALAGLAQGWWMGLRYRLLDPRDHDVLTEAARRYIAEHEDSEFRKGFRPAPPTARLAGAVPPLGARMARGGSPDLGP